MGLRGFISVLLLVFFVAVSVTGILIHSPVHNEPSAEHGLPPAMSKIPDNHPGTLDMPAEEDFLVKRLHEWSGYSFILVGLAHLLFNYKPLMRHLSIKK